MTEIVQGLFGVSPEQLRMQQQQALQEQANTYAQMSPEAQSTAAIYRGANQLGGAIGGLLGGVDPMQQQASKIASVLQGEDQTTAQGMMNLYKKFTEAGLPQQAQMAAAKVQELQKNEASVAQLTAKAQQEQAAANSAAYKIKQDEDLRTALVALGPDASEAAMLKTVMAYGSPDKVLAVVQQASDKKAAREQAITIARESAQAKVDAAMAAGASRREVAQIQADSRVQIAQLVAALKTTTKDNKPLSAGLQKDEITDLSSLDTYTAQQEALAPSIENLTPNAKGVRKLELGPLKNAEYAARNLSGNSTPESRAYEALKSAVDTAVNLQVSAEKGVQTDKDVLRFAQALIASYGRNDTQATLEALTRYKEAIGKAATRTQGRVESRRKSQGVEAYGFPSNPATTSFTSVAEAEAANLPKGTAITINGRKAIVE